jgi:hypothetical protein
MISLKERVNASDVKDKWGVTLSQRLKTLSLRKKHLSFKEYNQQKQSIIMSYNKYL